MKRTDEAILHLKRAEQLLPREGDRIKSFLDIGKLYREMGR
jgi:hypothetical protein